jgi:peptidoglycan/LPS O-acetylase OafA/YrhL
VLGPLCAALVVVIGVARAWAVTSGATPIDLYVLTPVRADGLATGAFLAWALRGGSLQGRGRLALIAGAVAIAGVAATAAVDGESWWWGPWMQRAGYSLLAVGGGALLVAAVQLPPEHWWPRMLSAGWLRAFGKYSYCLYLIHLPVMRVVREFVLGPDAFGQFGSPWIGQLVFYAAATGPAFALAWLSWRFFEEPILRLKSRFPY